MRKRHFEPATAAHAYLVQPIARHTPGPWTEECGTEDAVYVSTAGSGDFKLIAAAYRADVGGMEAVANADVIAAAPELLAALERALLDSGCDGDLCCHEWHEMARSAISKARGEQPNARAHGPGRKD